MSTSDRQGSAPLTRKQLREARLTGATNIVTAEQADAAQRQEAPAVPAPTPAASVPAVSAPVPSMPQANPFAARSASPAPQAPEPRAPQAPAAPQAVAPATPAPAPTGSGSGPQLTRRQIRQLEQARSGALPVFGETTPLPARIAADDAEPVSAASAPRIQEPVLPKELPVEPEPAAPSAAEPVRAEPRPDTSPFGGLLDPTAPSPVVRRDDEAATHPAPPAASPAIAAEVPAPSPMHPAPTASGAATVRDAFGQNLIESGGNRGQASPPSFDALLSTDSHGSHRGGSSLIFQQGPGAMPLSGPVSATGELLVTGTFALPEGLGSRGHSAGTDGKEVDAVLIDGELPPASSPTPIAASSAISTIKPAAEVIRPPEPEKGNKLMLTLTITAGALAAALVGALAIAISTGAFS